jgi:hypothetical protein
LQINELFKRSFADVGQYDDYAWGMPMRICYDLYKGFEAKRINYDNADFYIISEATDVDRIVRLATLMPSTVTFTNLNNTVVQIDHGIWHDHNEIISYEVDCHLPDNHFFRNYKTLLTEGVIQYYPNTAYYIEHPNGKTEWSKVNTIEHPNAVIELNEQAPPSDLLNQMLSFEIPYLFETPIEDFSKIVIQNMDALRTFKSMFNKELCSLDMTKQKEKSDFEWTMNSEVKRIANDYRRESLKLKKNLIIGSIATATSVLLVLSDIGQLTSVLSSLTGGAGIYKLINDTVDFHINKTKIKEENYYFLWLLKKNQNKH